ncbi:MAG: hypothetical protein QXD89_01760 [Candidatus Aenigmatarchaeota archaeon]
MGRKPYRQIFYSLLLSVLDEHIPQNIESIRRLVSVKAGKNVSWNTIKKYVDELIEIGRIEKIQAGKIWMFRKKV